MALPLIDFVSFTMNYAYQSCTWTEFKLSQNVVTKRPPLTISTMNVVLPKVRSYTSIRIRFKLRPSKPAIYRNSVLSVLLRRLVD